MSKNNNLHDYLSDLANAIREKKGTSGAINAQDFASEIASIEGGGSGSVVVMAASDVNFYDFDGTLLYAYTKEEFAGLTEMPAVPEKEGFTSQGWNWDLDKAQEYVANYGILDIGALRITADRKTRYYISVTSVLKRNINVAMSLVVSDSSKKVIIDWGDGSENTILTGNNNKNAAHTYEALGDYVIEIDIEDGIEATLGNTSVGAMGSNSNPDRANINMLRKAEIGKNVVAFARTSYSYCHSLETINIPNSVTSFGDNVFQSCSSLKAAILPRVETMPIGLLRACYSLKVAVFAQETTSIGDNFFNTNTSLERLCVPEGVELLPTNLCPNCTSLKRVVLPNSIKTFDGTVFSYCYSLEDVVLPPVLESLGTSNFYNNYSLRNIVIPSSVKSIGASCFVNAYSLTSINLPDGITTINSATFQSCTGLASMVYPSSVETIGANAFNTCYGIVLHDFRRHTFVPTLAATTAYNGAASTCKFVVPDELYDEWIGATNWSSFASKIVKASEYDG